MLANIPYMDGMGIINVTCKISCHMDPAYEGMVKIYL